MGLGRNECEVFDDRVCGLGEGPLWHPLREELFWFDITGRRLLSKGPLGSREWALPEMFSAAGWVDEQTLVVASETGLWLFSLPNGKLTRLCLIEADTPATRSNDGRADPYGGFWIGTMGKAADPGRGSIWRWHAGELRRLYAGMTIPNTICFAPDGSRAYFSDTPTGQICTVALDRTGWPAGSISTVIDLSGENLSPDGAVTDSIGNLWVAQWGRGRIAGYTPAGKLIRILEVNAPHCSCPAFGGQEFGNLFVTSATEGLEESTKLSAPLSGATFWFPRQSDLKGKSEPQVIICS